MKPLIHKCSKAFQNAKRDAELAFTTPHLFYNNPYFLELAAEPFVATT